MKQPQNASWSATRSGGGVDISGDSAELIAFSLLRSIIAVERQRLGGVVESKDWILNTYAECLAASQGRRVPVTPAETSTQVVLKRRGGTKQPSEPAGE